MGRRVEKFGEYTLMWSGEPNPGWAIHAGPPNMVPIVSGPMNTYGFGIYLARELSAGRIDWREYGAVG